MTPARNLGTTITIALLLAAALGGCSGDDPAARAGSTAVADDPTSSPSDSPPEGPVDLKGMHGPLEPGTYSMPVWGESRRTGPLPRAIVEVPVGYHSTGGYVVDAGDGMSDDQYGDVTVWHVDQVPTDPCRPRTNAAVGPTVDDLAQALVQQRGPSTQPHPVNLAGHRGLQLDVFIAPDMTLATCPAGQYSLWKDNGHSPTDLVHHLWILDVDGTRLVVVATQYLNQPDVPPEELIGIAESVRFEPAAEA